jgi:hypothetical protein
LQHEHDQHKDSDALKDEIHVEEYDGLVRCDSKVTHAFEKEELSAPTSVPMRYSNSNNENKVDPLLPAFSAAAANAAAGGRRKQSIDFNKYEDDMLPRGAGKFRLLLQFSQPF